MTLKRFLSLLTAVLILAPLAARSAERGVSVRGVRPLGMGDAYTAVADDQNVFFYNPAGTTQRTGSLFTLFELPITIGTDLQDAYDYINDNEDKLTDFNTLSAADQAALINEIDRKITRLNPHIAAGFPNINFLSGPSENGWHWGLGLFGQVDGSFRLNTGIVPNLDYDVNVDMVPALNVAKQWEDVWRIPGKLSTGVNLKYIRRSQVNDTRVSFLQLEDFSSPPMQDASGFGADLGFLYQPTDRWNVGLAAIDFLGTSLHFDATNAEKGFIAKPSRDSGIPARWNAGFAWTPARIGFSRFGLPTRDRLTLAMDVKDFANGDSPVLFADKAHILPDTAWTHVHLGAEYRWWFLRFRGGANAGYPTFGLGVDIPLLKIDYAYYSDELARFAGTLEQSNHMLSIALRFGTGNTEARERIRGSKEAARERRRAKKESSLAPPAPAEPMPEAATAAEPQPAATESAPQP